MISPEQLVAVGAERRREDSLLRQLESQDAGVDGNGRVIPFCGYLVEVIDVGDGAALDRHFVSVSFPQAVECAAAAAAAAAHGGGLLLVRDQVHGGVERDAPLLEGRL